MSSNNSSSSSSGGIGFVGLLTIVFITLKLLGQIHWSWIWVLSPIWISALLFFGFLLLIGGGALLIAALDERSKSRRFKKTAERPVLGARRTSARVIDVERKKEDSFLN